MTVKVTLLIEDEKERDEITQVKDAQKGRCECVGLYEVGHD